jgi:pyruvyltransferase
MKKVNTWWSKPLSNPGNFGDILSSFILQEMGYDAVHVDRSVSHKLVCIGSTARFIKKGDTVWGTGIMNKSDPIEKDAKYLAVRGPLTGNKVGCDVYGDPGLLCSHFWPFEKQGISPLGFIPHYVDYDKHDIGGHTQINVRNNTPVEVIREIVKCDSIISSSLHGIIVAHSYGIPAGWWKPSNKISGDGSKFEDYAQSVGITLTPERDYRNVKMTLPSACVINKIQERLLNAATGILC